MLDFTPYDRGFNKEVRGMIDDSYLDDSRKEICRLFKEDLKKCNLYGQKKSGYIIQDEDFLLPMFIINKIRDVFPEDEDCLLFWTDRSMYVQDDDNYKIFYPIINGEKDQFTNEYIVSKLRFNLFLFCDMYTVEAQDSVYIRMKLAKISVPYISAPPPSIMSIKNDGQMKILTDFVEVCQDIEFEDGDQVLIVGSSSEGGVCAGKSYNVLSYMTDKKIKVELYDPNDVDVTYVINSVEYIHRSDYYEYNGSENKYKLLIDDVWVDNCSRQWDPNNYYSLAKFFSIKWFPFYDDKMKKRHGNIKKQKYYTSKKEQRYSNIYPMVKFKRCDFLGTCPKCVWFKYFLRKDFSVEFYDYILKMHLMNCITREKRSFEGEGNVQIKDMQWFKVQPDDLFLSGWSTVGWDPVKGLPLMFPSDTNIKGRNIAFTSKKNVRPDIYNLSNVLLCRPNGDYYINRDNMDNFEYLENVEYYDEMEFLNQVIKQDTNDIVKSHIPLVKMSDLEIVDEVQGKMQLLENNIKLKVNAVRKTEKRMKRNGKDRDKESRKKEEKQRMDKQYRDKGKAYANMRYVIKTVSPDNS